MTEQPLPSPGEGEPVADQLRDWILERKELGIRRYGRPLEAHNGRDALRDALEEAVDLSLYLAQVIIERDGKLPDTPEA